MTHDTHLLFFDLLLELRNEVLLVLEATVQIVDLRVLPVNHTATSTRDRRVYSNEHAS